MAVTPILERLGLDEPSFPTSEGFTEPVLDRLGVESAPQGQRAPAPSPKQLANLYRPNYPVEAPKEEFAGELVPSLHGQEMDYINPNMSPRRRMVAESILQYGKGVTREFEDWQDPGITDSITDRELQWASGPPKSPLGSLLNFAFGESMTHGLYGLDEPVPGLANMDKMLRRALYSDDPFEEMKAITDMWISALDAFTVWGPPATVGIRAAGKSLKGMAKLGMYPPRLVISALDKVTPKHMKPWPLLENVWERIIIPKGDLKPFNREWMEKLQQWWVQRSPMTGRYIPTYAGEVKSLTEILQPHVERLERVKRGFGTLGTPFRTAQASKALVTKAGELLGDDIKKLPLPDQLEAMRGAKSMFMDSPAAKKVWFDFERRIGSYDLKEAYMKEYGLAWEKIVEREKYDFGNLENVTNFPEIKEFFTAIDDFIAGRPLKGIGPSRDVPKKTAQLGVKLAKQPPTKQSLLTTENVMQKKLKAVIEHPHATKEMQILARDMYNLPTRVPMAVAEASKDASTAFLLNRLKQLGVVKANLKKGDNAADYLYSTYPKTKGLHVLRDVEFELRTLEEIPKMAHRKMNKWLMTPWKTSKVILRGATHVRNILSNIILNDWGGLPFYRADRYVQAYKAMTKNHDTWKQWQKLTGGGGSFSMNEIVEVGKGLTYNANMYDHGLAIFDRIARPFRKLYNAEEQWAKMAKFIHNKAQGMAPREAAIDAMKYTFNYGEITRFTSFVRSNMAPFFTWQSKVIPLMAETAVKHPIRLGKWYMFYQMFQANALDNLDIDEGEWNYINSILPEYVQQGQFLVVPWRDEKKRLQLLNLTYMMPGFGDLADINAHPMGWLIGHPLITIGGSLHTNTKFSGAPITFDWEAPKVQWAKKMAYVWEQLMPSMMYGGVDYNRIVDTIKDHPDAWTTNQMMASVSGFPIKPIDETKAARSKQILDQIHKQQMGSQMKKELKGARSPSERNDIIQKYMEYQRGMAP